MTIVADPLDPYVAWCAGLYEGEGTVCYYLHRPTPIKNRRQYEYAKITLQISMTDPEPLEKFQEFMECGVLNGPYYKGPNRKAMYQYNISIFKDIKKVIDVMSPWLSSSRIDQWEIAKKKYLEMLSELNSRKDNL